MKNKDVSESINMDNYYKTAIGKNFDNYVDIINKYENTGGYPLSWHWPALFFGPAWALYRKMYGVFIVYLICGIVLFSLGKYNNIWNFFLIFFSAMFATLAKSIYVRHISNKIKSFSYLDNKEIIYKLKLESGTNTWVIYLVLILNVIGIIASVILPRLARDTDSIIKLEQAQLRQPINVSSVKLDKTTYIDKANIYNKSGFISSCEDGDGYTYIYVSDDKARAEWIATPRIDVTSGNVIEYPVTKQIQYYSRKLNRHFAEISFVPSVNIVTQSVFPFRK